MVVKMSDSFNLDYLNAFHFEHRTCIALQMLIKERPRRILDVGCGDGSIGKYLLDMIDAEVYGVDISQLCVEENILKGIKAQQIDVSREQLPYKDEAFDAVLFARTLEHLIDPDFALKEIHRILKPKGILVLSTPNLAAWFNRIILLIGLQPIFTDISTKQTLGRKWKFLGQNNPSVNHLRIFTLEALKDILALHNFKIIKIRGAVFIENSCIFNLIDKFFSFIPSFQSYIIIKAMKSSA